jgi:hypothetical protein
VLDEPLVLMRGERRAHRGHEQPVELVAFEPLVCRVFEVCERTGAELGVRTRLKVLVGEPVVFAQLLLV